MSEIRIINKDLTEKDWEAINKANDSSWEEIDLDWAETEAGREEVRRIRMRKYHYDEYRAGMI